MDILQDLGLLSGLPGMIVAIVSTIIGVIYAINSSRSRARQIADEGFEKAVAMMKKNEEILEKRIAILEEENKRLTQELKELRGERM